jgi:hypothetical protein
MADAEPPGKRLSYQVLAGTNLPVHNFPEQSLHKHLPAQAVVPWLRGALGYSRHDDKSSMVARTLLGWESHGTRTARGLAARRAETARGI